MKWSGSVLVHSSPSLHISLRCSSLPSTSITSSRVKEFGFEEDELESELLRSRDEDEDEGDDGVRRCFSFPLLVFNFFNDMRLGRFFKTPPKSPVDFDLLCVVVVVVWGVVGVVVVVVTMVTVAVGVVVVVVVVVMMGVVVMGGAVLWGDMVAAGVE